MTLNLQFKIRILLQTIRSKCNIRLHSIYFKTFHVAKMQLICTEITFLQNYISHKTLKNVISLFFSFN